MQRPERYGSPDPEKLDHTPVEMPLGYIRPTPLQDLITSMVREAVQQESDESFETEKEANDFEEEDHELLDMSPYTLVDIPDEEFDLQPKPADPEPAANEDKSPEPTGDPPPQNAEETGQP